MDVAKQFLEQFPITNSVMEFFVPKNWGQAQKKKVDYVKMESVTLGQLDAVYGEDGLVRTIIKLNLGGIYSMGMNREVMNQDTATVTADLFAARYADCTMFQMLVYFSGYLTDYKGSYQNYDVQDILLQFTKKFQPWVRQKMAVKEVKKVVEVKSGPVGMEGLKMWLREALMKGEDVREGGLYRLGYVTDEMIEGMRKQMEKEVW